MSNAVNFLSKSEFENKLIETVSNAWWEPPSELMTYVVGKPQKQGMKHFALEHCYFADHFPRWFAPIVGNCPYLDARRYMIGNMYVEEVEDPTINDSHYESLVNFAVAMGAARDEVYRYRPSMEMLMAVHYLDNIARTQPWLVAFAAIGGTEFANNAKLAKRHGMKPLNSRAHFEKFGFGAKELAHWDAGEAADQGDDGHGQETLNLVCKYARGAEEQQACIAALAESLAVLHHAHDAIGRRARQADSRLAA